MNSLRRNRSTAESQRASSIPHVRVLLGIRLLLGEHSDAEVSILVRLKGGRDDQVLSRGELEARAHLPQIDEGFGLGCLSVAQEEGLVQVYFTLTFELEEGHNTDCVCHTLTKQPALGLFTDQRSRSPVETVEI